MSTPRIALVRSPALAILRRPPHRATFLTRLVLAACLSGALAAAAAESSLLWEIGKPDRGNAEFALAPNHFGDFRADGLFVVGRSEAKRDWPYVHPGPADTWAGGRSHTFTIMFALKTVPPEGECRLKVALLDTHSGSPPRLRIQINGQTFEKSLPQGGGDASANGDLARAKPFSFEVVCPASALKPGDNEVRIATRSGSWLLYDWIGFETPPGLELGQVEGRTIVDVIEAQPVLVERDGKLLQTLRVEVRHLAEATDATIRIEGLEPVKSPLASGSQSLEVPLPAVEKETTLTVSVEAAGKVAASQPVTVKPVRKWVVYLLPHSHVDIGYTHRQADVERAQWSYLEQGIRLARESASNPPGARFKWNTEVLWAVDSYLNQAAPARQQEFFEAVRLGWVGLDALYGNELTGLCRPEELLRLVGWAARLGRRTGVPIESAMITDVPGYTWGIVPAFAHSGVKYFSIGPNGGDRIGHTIAARGDKPFYWIGPNGRDRVLVWMTGTGYYQVFQSAQRLHQYLGQLEAKAYPYDLVQVRHCTGDNGAPDPNFAATVKKWNETHAFPKLVIATTAEMFRDFERRYGSSLPQAQGDFTPYWEDGAASSARETSLNRDAAERLTQAETLFSMFNPAVYPAARFNAAWRNAVLYDEHTWGAHNSISEPDAQFVKDQWKYKQAFAVDAQAQSRQLLAEALGQRGGAADTVEAEDVFNTTSWARTDLVIVESAEPGATLNLAGYAVQGPDGQPVPAQRLASGALAFLARDVPPLGSKRFRLGPGQPVVAGAAQAGGNTLRTSRVSLRVDERTGAITSLRCQGIEADLVNGKAPVAINDYLYLPGSDLKGLKRNGAVTVKVQEAGPLVASLLIESEAPGCRRLTREVRVIDGLDRIDLINTVDKLPVRTKEGVHFGFGFNVPNGVVRMDVPWAVVRPEADQIQGACKNWFTVQHWVDVSNDGFGIAWATPDAPLVEVGGVTANLIGSLSDPKAWLDRLEPSQTVYSWAMNNHWHTNYRAEQDGPTVFRYALWPHGPCGTDALARFGAGYSQPLLAVPAAGAALAASRLTIEPANVVITAFKPSEDGKAWIVRLFGATAEAAQARISWSDPAPKAVCQTDNSEKPGDPVTGTVAVPGFTIVSLRAER